MGFFNATNNIAGQMGMMATAKAKALQAQNQLAQSNNLPGQGSMRNAAGVNSNISGFGGSLINNTVKNVIPRSINPINPKAFSNPGAIANLYGQANQGTFTRTVQSPFAQTMDPNLAMQVDPTNPGMPAAIQNDMAATGVPMNTSPIPPPEDVAQQITPTYDLSNI